MAITVPAAGDAVTAAWGASVANLANQLIPLITTADVVSSSASWADVTGLTFAVTAGKRYVCHGLLLRYSCVGTSTGLSIGFTHPGGAVRMFNEIHGVTSAATHTDEHISGTDTGTGTSAVNAGGTNYLIETSFTYVCTVTGTFALRRVRNGTSTDVTIYEGSGGLVVASA